MEIFVILILIGLGLYTLSLAGIKRPASCYNMDLKQDLLYGFVYQPCYEDSGDS